jgi:hypothetical protein
MSVIWIDSGRFAVAAANLLLDTYTGAAAAYSLRQLRTGVTSVVRVRRSSDNTESDFTAAQVTDGTLASWVGAGGNGFVRTWYDQSGNGFHLAQTSASNQPQIVSGGTVITKGSRSSIKFDGSTNNDTNNDRLVNASISVAQPATHFLVGSRDSATQNADIFFESFNDTGHALLNAGSTETPNQSWVFASGANLSTATPATTELVLLSVLANGASSLLRTNGTQRASGNAGSNALSGLSLGNLRGNPSPISGGSGLYALTGCISEYIVFPSNQSANFLAVESNINANYSMY